MLHGNIWYKIRPSVALNGGVGFSSPRVSPKGSMYKNNSEVSSLDQWPVYDYENDGHWLNNMYVTGKDIDEVIKRLSFTISEALNIALEL